jgi:hypothetical protein
LKKCFLASSTPLAIAVAHHDQRGEAEAATALDDLGYAVDGDDPLEVRSLLDRRAIAAAVTAVVATPALVALAAVARVTGPGAPALWTCCHLSTSPFGSKA